MSLQRRLTLFFILIVILPLAAAGLVVQRVVVGEVKRRAEESLRPALSSAVSRYNDSASDAVAATKLAVKTPRFARLVDEGNKREIEHFLRGRLGPAQRGGLDFMIVFDQRGRVAGSAAMRGDFVAGFNPPSIRDVAARPERVDRGAYATARIPVLVQGRGRIAAVVGGFWLDQDLLPRTTDESVDLMIEVDGRVVAASPPIDSAVPAPSRSGDDVSFRGQSNIVEKQSIGETTSVLAATPLDPVAALSGRLFLSMIGLLLLAFVVTAVLAYALARSITQPLDELVRGADAVAEGRFDYEIPVRSRDEVGQLAVAFNDMTHRLRDTIGQLSSSRSQLQRAVERVGETLRSTHDMRQILEAILNTASDAVEADAAMLWRLNRTRDELFPILGTNLEVDEFQRVPVGTGLVGHVAERGTSTLLPIETGLRPSNLEPNFPVAIAIPLYSQNRIMGVIALYRRNEDALFTYDDLDTVMFLSEQGGVAIENVQLHEEAQRLSITDGLTSVWNRRYFHMQFRQMLATAIRFRRTFSLLMLDLDHFKQVNDTYGHQRGDAILIEFAQRVSRTLREVDTFARYGGEEFICLLSETDVYGGLIAAEKIQDVIRNESFGGGAGEAPIHLTVSIGVSCYPEHGDTYKDLVEAADQAMYRAKQEGRDRVRVAEKPPPNLKLAR